MYCDTPVFVEGLHTTFLLTASSTIRCYSGVCVGSEQIAIYK